MAAGLISWPQLWKECNMQKDIEINVIGLPLSSCSQDPLTGFFRDGSCNTCGEDAGSHTVCAVMTAEFLAFSKYRLSLFGS